MAQTKVKIIETDSNGVPRDRVEALTAERDYLWRELATIEAWILTAPNEDLSRVRARVKAALDGFKPSIKISREPPTS
jgi:hypothetical protein